jgi:hypothetical protein
VVKSKRNASIAENRKSKKISNFRAQITSLLHQRPQALSQAGTKANQMNNNVFNNTIGSKYSLENPSFNEQEQRAIIADLFEQMLIFDRITLSTNRLNYTLALLIAQLGLNTVERMFESGYIKIMLWSPMIFTGKGRQKPDGTMDLSVIYDQPPLATGSLVDEDLDPDRNIEKALSYFNFHRDRKRIFTRIARKHYIIPDGMQYSSQAGEFIMDAYTSNNLGQLGLPYEKEPNQLHLPERELLLELGYKVLETAVVSEYGLKSYGDHSIPGIYQQNLQNIGNALKVEQNTSALLKIEAVPNLKDLFLQERLDFDSVFKIRHSGNAKYFRKWINQVSADENAQEISVEYLNEIKGTNKFFESTGGKFIKNVGMYTIGAGLGVALAGPAGAAIGAVGVKATEFGLGLLDTFVLDGLLKGKTPNLFIDDLKKEIEP